MFPNFVEPNLITSPSPRTRQCTYGTISISVTKCLIFIIIGEEGMLLCSPVTTQSTSLTFCRQTYFDREHQPNEGKFGNILWFNLIMLCHFYQRRKMKYIILCHNDKECGGILVPRYGILGTLWMEKYQEKTFLIKYLFYTKSCAL